MPPAVPAASQALTKCGYNRRTPPHPPPPTHAQHSCLPWREKREESPEKQACHRTGRERVKLHQEISCINPLSATRPRGGLSRHLDAEPPSNPLRTGWASRTLISKTPHYWSWKEPPHPQQKQLPTSGAHRPHPEPRGHPLTCPVSKGTTKVKAGHRRRFPQQAPHPPSAQRDTEVSGGQRVPGREGICLPFLSNESHLILPSEQPWQVFYYSQVQGEETEAPQ